ncbi:RNA methyltransferase [Rhodopirellula halodulae]|uniref:RNA methyltransferase n=1 Tax=Rhodopirellula halodulae TaxID=2894198 RepID=UPI001E2EF893|nr:RNA methyltransferase [Rhodopirellula sp. JC737]MCC9657311.1 RNA methyltransferase [Rhodopirellula sp. JC737]
METIRSLQNASIRRIASLRKSRRRRAAGVVLVDGPRETLRAIEAGLKMIGFYEIEPKSDPEAERQTEREMPEQAPAREHAIANRVHRYVTADVFRKIAYTSSTDRCVAEFESPDNAWKRVRDGVEARSGLILVLDQVEKPGNLGAVFRTADAAGVSAVLLADCPSDQFNPNAIRGSLGAVFTVPSAAGTETEVSAFLREHGYRVAAMRVEGSKPLFESDLTGKVAVVLGSEADGLGDRWGGDEIHPVALPMAGHVDSLNVSVSAAIVAYEAVRQNAAS